LDATEIKTDISSEGLPHPPYLRRLNTSNFSIVINLINIKNNKILLYLKEYKLKSIIIFYNNVNINKILEWWH